MGTSTFEILEKDRASSARLGLLPTPHGAVPTPSFCIPATQGTVSSLDPGEVRGLGGSILHASTYHLILRPGSETVARLGGLHRLMAWNQPILSDGGTWWRHSFSGSEDPGTEGADQVYPMGHPVQRPRILQVDDDGITFTSYVDGSRHHLTPEEAIRAQERMGADIVVTMDPWVTDSTTPRRTAEAVSRAESWAQRSIEVRTRSDQQIWGALCIQDGEDNPGDEVEATADRLAALAVDGWAIRFAHHQGGPDLGTTLARLLHRLPPERPRHVLTSGGPIEIVQAAQAGADLVESSAPTRFARRGLVYTNDGILNVASTSERANFGPIDTVCPCVTCAQFSRAYIHHLFVTHELLAYRLATLHNLAFCTRILDEVRAAIESSS